MQNSPYDIVVFGATSFVGQILTRYLVDYCATSEECIRWAIAGRSEAKLLALRSSLGGEGGSLPLIVADAADEDQLKALCSATRVVVSTVGPYALYGEPLVRECAATGTDYCDLTGEVQWIRRMIDTYAEMAEASGARIVHCCGFDSVPSDMGVFFLQQLAVSHFGEPASRVKMRVKFLKGGASGGTVASLLNMMKEAAANPALRQELQNPYSICPDGAPSRARQHAVTSAEYDADFDAWIGPFVMAMINERVVHRSNALAENAYGEDFTYNEAMLMGAGIQGRLRAVSLAGGLGAVMAGAAIGPVRQLMERFVFPSPGEGPDEEAQRSGRFDLRFSGETASGDRVRVKVTGDRDPGYGSTAKMLGQAALSLAFDLVQGDADNTGKAGRGGGFWTPATLFDERYLTRLCRHAGLTFEELPQ
ncbi:saccharopine dehydrogenase [Parahaliea maris]|uniref:Saccharopine dehydrogenase n=1 Tax=Parahaliea maris TaxID=2716870 RepID=A0A5C8ZP18_9GAMM|nr:saccharopine dehydrogenase NADP-binding domain-containing protein [Parahaliea maris]TXS90233.1 saccharopine dehydrogenase [Parahaliea maris]